MAKYTGRYAKGKKQSLLILVLLAVLLLGLITAGVAYYLQETGGVTAKYDLAYVSCEIHEDFTGQEKSSITVENTSNVPVYIRIRLVSYWQTPSGKIAGRSSPELSITPGSDWESLGNDTWLYKTPVEPGKSTGNLLGVPLLLSEDNEGYIPVVKVLAEAIQTDAVQDAWGVTP